MTPTDIILRHYEGFGEALEILLSHSRDVCRKALEVVDRHPELGADREFVAEAAMLHDIGIVLCNAPSIGCYGAHQYIEHGYLGGDILRAEDLPRHALVAERHTGTGITPAQIAAQQLPLPPGREYCPQSVEELIVCYADKFFSKTSLGVEKTPEQVRRSLQKFGEESVSRFDAWHALLG